MDRKKKINKKNIFGKIIYIFIIILVVSILCYYKYKRLFSDLEWSGLIIELRQLTIIQIIMIFIVLGLGISIAVLRVKSLNKDKYSKKYNLFSPYKMLSLLFYFFISMCAIIIIFLGALQSNYNYKTTFLNDSQKNFMNAGEAIGKGFMSFVTQLYNLGREKPLRWIVICLAATIVLLFNALKRAKEEEFMDLDAEGILKETDEKLLTKEDLQDIKMLMNGKMRESIVEKLEINSYQMKGGKVE